MVDKFINIFEGSSAMHLKSPIGSYVKLDNDLSIYAPGNVATLAAASLSVSRSTGSIVNGFGSYYSI